MQKKSVIMNHSICWTFFCCPMKHEFANIKKHTLILYGAFIMKCIPQLEPVMNHRKKFIAKKKQPILISTKILGLTMDPQQTIEERAIQHRCLKEFVGGN